ncbi:hypothetical protein GCM10022204_12800 [Microlunatus aurantiacus]|uniref:Uncharacterized protein n=1 Tax=Microlunatus aurantiacus TaxID=446786 RepID=A0ABP7CY08_9ACTN
MTRRWLVAVAVAAVVAVSLVVGLVVVDRSPAVRGAEAPRTSQPGTPPPTPTPTAAPPTTGPRSGPPAGTVHVDDRYRARYAGRYVGWDELLTRGRPLPAVTARCRADWKATSRDRALDWGKSTFFCLDQLTGNGFHPQGLGGTSTTQDYRIGGRPAADRNIIAISSYSRKQENGLLYPHRPGFTDATRLTVIDLDRRVYNQVELVRLAGTDGFSALDSHGSGVVWVGQYLYSSSLRHLWMYNADDLMEIDGHFVLPAVAHWRARGTGGFSSISVDPTTSPRTLTAINFTQTQTSWAQTFQLDRAGRLRTGAAAADRPLSLVGRYGPSPAGIRSSRSRIVTGSNFQGIGSFGPYGLVNSSSLKIDGRRHGDNLVVTKRGRSLARFSMPKENLESVYVDHRRRRYVTVTEYGRQFLFWLPLDHLIERAER